MYLPIFLLVVVIVSAVLQLAGRPRFSCWLLVVFPAMLCGAEIINLAHGVRALGPSAYSNDQQFLAYSIVLLALSVIAAVRVQWRWLYWSAFVFNALACSALVYLVYFWKTFS